MLVCAMPYRHGIDTATGPVSVLSLITVYSYFIYFDVFIADVQVVGVRVDLIDLIDLFPWRVFMGGWGRGIGRGGATGPPPSP